MKEAPQVKLRRYQLILFFWFSFIFTCLLKDYIEIANAGTPSLASIEKRTQVRMSTLADSIRRTAKTKPGDSGAPARSKVRTELKFKLFS